MTQPTKHIIKQLNELYVWTRFKYIMQTDSAWITVDQKKSERSPKFNDGMLKRHIDGKGTYGLFNGGYFNKFICFDVDFPEQQTARWMALKVADVLERSFNIKSEDIHISTSGQKGYHVELFFADAVTLDDIKRFYFAVMAEVGTHKGGQVELRPTFSQAVKLPLGIHKRTGNRCWFVDRYTLEPIESFDYVMAIKQIDSDFIRTINFDIDTESLQDFTEVANRTDISANVMDYSKTLKRIARIVDAGQLLESFTRNNTTFDLARFYAEHGYEEEEAVDAIMEILHNTPLDYFNKNSTPEFWATETIRIVKAVYEKGYTFGANRPVDIYESEILAILSAGTFRTKQMLFAMLVTSKRYGQTFFLTESTGMKMLGTTSKATVRSTIQRLVDGCFIEFTRKGQLDKARSRQENRPRYKPNKYRLLLEEPKEDEAYVRVTADDDKTLIEVARELVPEKDLKKALGRREYENRWKN